MTEKFTRAALALFCAALTVLLGLFVWVMTDASANPMSGVLMGSLFLVGGISAVSQAIYALKAQIFEFDGRLAAREILFSIICFQCIVQLGFGFSLYAVNQTVLQNDSYDSAYEFFISLQHDAPDNSIAGFQTLGLESGIHDMPDCIESVSLVSVDDFSDAKRYFRFPLDDGKLLMRKSESYFNKNLLDFAVNMLMSLVISLLLMIELVYFTTKYLESRINAVNQAVNNRMSTDGASDNTAQAAGGIRAADYLRQIAFLFYFAGFLGSSFVPILARELASDNPNANFIAGLPYSVEAFANCLAIIITAPIFRKKGWKPPFMTGVFVFASGLLLSALSNNVYMFVLARGVAGVGYGLCWMTMRNITALSGNRAINFSNLTSGIYAGIMCGVAFGAVLADNLGYRNVLIISALLCAAAALFPLTIRNEKTTASAGPAGGTSGIRLTPRDIIIFTVFLLGIVIPACVSEAFCAYVSPLRVSELGLPTAFAGRVSLVYNLCIVYISSTLILRFVIKKIKNPLLRNLPHMILISAAPFSAAYIGGFQALLISSAILGSADGFGFSVQNAYVLETKICGRIGDARMLTFFSLFKKFGAMLGPIVFGLVIGGGMGNLWIMGAAYLICALACVFLITFLQRKDGMTTDA